MQKVLVSMGVLVLMVVLMELVGHWWDRGLSLPCPTGAPRAGGGDGGAA